MAADFAFFAAETADLPALTPSRAEALGASEI